MTSNTYIVARCQPSVAALRAAIAMLTPPPAETCVRAEQSRHCSARTRSSTGAIRSGCALGPLQCCLRAVLGEPSSAITFQAGDQVCPEGNRVVSPIHAGL